MTVKNRFKERYKIGDTPWDIGKPDFNLIETVNTWHIKPCKALEIGCGTGDNSIWLARNGFDVTGIDASEIAIKKAIQKASDARTRCTFLVKDFFKDRVESAPFGFTFDRGCFHSFDTDDERKEFARRVSGNLKEDGLWLSLIGNADENRQGPGPPQRTARDIVVAIEPYFEILLLRTTHFESARPDPPRAWVCLMKKRPA